MDINWEENDFLYPPQYAEDAINLITADKGRVVFDLGCGNGTLTKKLAQNGYNVIGIDSSKEKLALAKAKYPEIDFREGNAVDFYFRKRANVIFSSALFHRINEKEQDKLIKNIANNLDLGGQLVCEFGGVGNAEAVLSPLKKAFEKYGVKYEFDCYFPTIGEYAAMLEKHGLRVEYAELVKRPFELKGKDGLSDWINAFMKKPFEGIDEETKENILFDVLLEASMNLYRKGKWFIDYVHLRIRAKNVNGIDISYLYDMCPDFSIKDILDAADKVKYSWD